MASYPVRLKPQSYIVRQKPDGDIELKTGERTSEASPFSCLVVISSYD